MRTREATRQARFINEGRRHWFLCRVSDRNAARMPRPARAEAAGAARVAARAVEQASMAVRHAITSNLKLVAQLLNQLVRSAVASLSRRFPRVVTDDGRKVPVLQT